jgi:glycosyltransferase involved in cell wall biosynthesis
MRVVHFAHVDAVGGSGRSATRIHDGLRQLDVDSRMLVERKVSDDPDVRILHDDKPLMRTLDNYGRKLTRRLGLQDLIIPSSYGTVRRHPWVTDADVVQIFNTWNGFLSYMALPGLNAGAPLVWRLSDEWLYTGHCVYTYDCDRWQTGCGRCPQVDGERALPFDTSALLWQLKRLAYSRTSMHIVAPSRWIAERARQSPLIGHLPVTVIPNGVDLSVYGSISQEAAREQLGIEQDERVVLFSAQHLDTGRKGGHLLREALAHLSGMAGTLLLLGDLLDDALDVPDRWRSRPLGYLQDDRSMAAAYAAANVFVLPSLADNLPNTALESMACRTPIVAFDVGGVGDAVRHGETGWLAPAGDAHALADGLRRLLTDDDLRFQLGEGARQVTEAEYNQVREAHDFLSLYERLLAHDGEAT